MGHNRNASERERLDLNAFLDSTSALQLPGFALTQLPSNKCRVVSLHKGGVVPRGYIGLALPPSPFPPPLWGRAGVGGRNSLPPHPNPPPPGGREILGHPLTQEEGNTGAPAHPRRREILRHPLTQEEGNTESVSKKQCFSWEIAAKSLAFWTSSQNFCLRTQTAKLSL